MGRFLPLIANYSASAFRRKDDKFQATSNSLMVSKTALISREGAIQIVLYASTMGSQFLLYINNLNLLPDSPVGYIFLTLQVEVLSHFMVCYS